MTMLRSVGARALIPLTVFTGAMLWLGAIALAAGTDPFRAETWIRWDSNHYLSIARSGYNLEPCYPGDPAAGWCGNARWFPGYPAVLTAVSLTGLPIDRSALLVAAVGYASLLSLVWFRGMASFRSRGMPILLLVAFFPGHIYYATVYPTGMATVFVLVFILSMYRQKWLAGGLAGALSAFTYPTALVLGPIGAVWVLLRTREGNVRRTLMAGGVATAVLLGGLSVMAIHKWQTGRWDAFLLLDAKYRSYRVPGRALFDRAVAVLEDGRVDLSDAVNLEFFLMIGGFLGLGMLLAFRRRDISADEWLLFGAMATLAFFPVLVGSDIAPLRSHALAAPVALLVSRAPTWVQVLTVVAAIVISLPLGLLFFRGMLV